MKCNNVWLYIRICGKQGRHELLNTDSSWTILQFIFLLFFTNVACCSCHHVVATLNIISVLFIDCWHECHSKTTYSFHIPSLTSAGGIQHGTFSAS